MIKVQILWKANILEQIKCPSSQGLIIPGLSPNSPVTHAIEGMRIYGILTTLGRDIAEVKEKVWLSMKNMDQAP
jgi:hypothetical protein